MQNQGLLFIPDISGFTRFVNATEIDHSRMIIQELLEIIINANQIGLEISEIEGDAILFYKFGQSPNLKELYGQVEKMFCEFHKAIIAYDNRKFCQCTACRSAIDLSLKVVTHYGEFTGYNVKNFNKLIGKDIIIAHQLLKNDIPQHEYWLVTNNLVMGEKPGNLESWMHWEKSSKETESGVVSFHYTQLGQLKHNLQPDSLPPLESENRTKLFSVTREYQADIITLFHAVGDFNFRSQWEEGVKRVEEIDHYLPRVGMRCRCIRDDGDVVIFASSYSYTPDKIRFTETTADGKNSRVVLLEKTGEMSTRLTIDAYAEKGPAKRILFGLFSRKKELASMNRSLDNLEKLAKEIKF